MDPPETLSGLTSNPLSLIRDPPHYKLICPDLDVVSNMFVYIRLNKGI